MVWGHVLSFLGSTILSSFLTPKPKVEKLKPATMDDVDAPVAEVGKEIPVVFGTRELSEPNVVWYGDLRAVAIRKKGGKK